jgi:hypothetical protein
MEDRNIDDRKMGKGFFRVQICRVRRGWYSANSTKAATKVATKEAGEEGTHSEALLACQG